MSPSNGGQLRLPQIDFRGLDLSSPDDGHLWDAVRAQVMHALESHGCFQAIYDAMSPEVKEQLFARAAPELFALPAETKMQSEVVGRTSNIPYQSYIGQFPSWAYESLCFDDAPRLESVDEFARRMWPPDGNPNFRDTVWTFAKHMKMLEQTVHRMIMQSFGVEKHYDSHVESLVYSLRMSEYGVPKDPQENKIAMGPHVDTNMITIVCQHQVDGLEVQNANGDWMYEPSADWNSYIVMVGDAFRAWSNGRLRAPVHRVRMPDDSHELQQVKRYSMIFISQPKIDSEVEAPEELIDEAHPRRFEPYRFRDYLRFRFSGEREPEEGEDTLRAFCGVDA